MASVLPFGDHTPAIEPDVFLAPTVSVIGDVVIGAESGLYPGVSVRGDSAPIRVGRRTNLQDNVVVHADAGFPATIGDGVSVGHSAVVHGCTIGDDCLVGMSATVMNGAVIGAQSLVAAGALVLEGTQVPARSLVAGVPAKVRRELTDEEVEGLRLNATHYVRLSVQHRDGATG